MIKIRLAGGLGNQILQLAAGISLSKLTNKKLLLYSKSLKEYNVKRDFKLSFLGFKTFNNFSFFDKLIFKFRLVYIMNIFFKNFLCDKNFSLYNLGYKFFFLDGYFHDLSNSKLGINELKKLINGINFNPKNLSIDFDNDVAVHVRRGDYLTKENRKIYKFLDKNYYISSLQEIDYKKIYIFSTEKIDFKLDENQVEIVNFNFNDIEEFLLMSKFKKIIISNSTFSFCAALLSSKKNKELIAPSIYYNDPISNKIWLKNFKDYNFRINNIN